MTAWEAAVTSGAEVMAVGLGVGGDFVAGRRAEAGLEVVGIESSLVGGECPYWGCVPSKMIIRAANALAKAKRVAASDILGQAHEPASYRALPRGTFTHPEVGAVGLIEAQARSRNVVVRTAVSRVPSSPRGWIQGPGTDGFIKLIADSDAGVLVGAASGGPVGGEGFGALAVAVHAQVPVAMLSKMIYAYPTFHALSKTLSPGFAYARLNEARSLQHVSGPPSTSRDRRAPRRASPR